MKPSPLRTDPEKPVPPKNIEFREGCVVVLATFAGWLAAALWVAL